MQIEIDFDVFKALTALRGSERDTHNDVLRDLLKLPKSRAPLSDAELARASAKGKVWHPGNIRFPAGTEFRARYKGKVHHASVADSLLQVDGRGYPNPSSAAFAITGTNVNGWEFWEAKLPDDPEWRKLSAYRRRPF